MRYLENLHWFCGSDEIRRGRHGGGNVDAGGPTIVSTRVLNLVEFECKGWHLFCFLISPISLRLVIMVAGEL